MYSKTISIAILAVVASGCASIVSGTSQSMFIETPQLTGASCKLTDSIEWRVVPAEHTRKCDCTEGQWPDEHHV